MINVLYDFSEYWEIPTLDGEECSILISSDDNESCKIVYDIVKEIYFHKELLYKACGFPNNIEDVLDMIHECNPIHFEGDGRKFYMKRYPEVIAKISTDTVLSDILNEWTSTIYESRYLYVVKEGQFGHIRDILTENVYVQSDNLSVSWTFLECLIKNVPEAKNHNTFMLTFRKDQLNPIKGIISTYMGNQEKSIISK